MAFHGPLAALFLVFSLLVNPAVNAFDAQSRGLHAAGNAAAQTTSSHVLQVSNAANRANPVSLQGGTVSGNIYVFVSPETGASQVNFYLDNPSASGTPVWSEGNPPWDFAGGNSAAATPYDTTKLPNGPHSITASISLSSGGTTLVTASFTVSNGVAATPVPPTATQAPTATSVPPTATGVPPTATGVPPTATSVPPTAVPPTAAPASTYNNLVSKSANRSSAIALNGQTVSGNIYVFVSPEAGAKQVRFYLDNPSASGTPIQTENGAPFDFAGGTTTAANAYDTRKLSNGPHTITTSITLTSGGTAVTTAAFTVNNSTTTNTPVPPTATATRQATATATRVSPTATPTAVPPTATPATTHSNLLSRASNRSSAVALNGQIVSGNIYVFVGPESGATQVNFYLDNPAGSGTAFRTEANAPWDFAGGSSTAANPYDTRQLSNGSHTITASITLSSGAKSVTTANFIVNNTTATNTPAPAPTATPGSTNGSIYWGVNMSGVPSSISTLSSWEQNVAGKAVSIVHWGHSWGDSSGNYRSWSNTAVNNVRGHGSIPMISWNPQGGDPGRWQLGDIINGSHDAYIRQFATDAKNWGHPLFARMMHEMNGSWSYPWQETQNGNSRGQFVQAWRHIVDIFRSVGATNVSYVWCPNIDYPTTPNPTFASVYPGDSYVDWTCLDGYNWGTNRREGWQTFDQVYNYSYNEILKVAPSKPMMLGEFGSVEQGGSKAAWITDALKTQLPQRYPRIRAVVYFNWQMSGVDWRVETSQSSIDAWKAGIASSYYAPNRYGALTGKPPVP